MLYLVYHIVGGIAIKEIIVGINDAGQRLDRFVLKAFPFLRAGVVQKYIRLKRIKLNGKRADNDARLCVGDQIQLYLNDEMLEIPAQGEEWRLIAKPEIDILYEDDNLLLIDKKPGISVQPDKNESVNTVSARLKAYMFRSGQWDPAQENAFSPALCNRIDRNTGGIVIAAKNAEALRILNEKIRLREIQKSYLCVVHGQPVPPAGTLTFYLTKDSEKNLVRVSDTLRRGALEAVTAYKTLEAAKTLSLLECRLITGRTHQIRASFAHIGHPLLGDGKYGREADNRRYGVFTQALLSYSVYFAFETPSGALSYLSGKAFSLDTGDFIKNYRDLADRGK